MARYLTANNPVKYWKQTGQDTVDGYVYRQGMWKEGYGFVANCSTKFDGGLHGMGILQLDGTFCPRLTGIDARWAWHDSFGLDQYSNIAMRGVHSTIWGEAVSPYNLRSLDGTQDGYNVGWHNWDPASNVRHAYTYCSGYLVPGSSGSNGYLLKQMSGDVRILRATFHAGFGMYFYELGANIPLDPLPLGAVTWSWKEGYHVYGIYPNGQGFLFDSSTNTFINTTIWIDDFSGFYCSKATYCKEHNIWIVLCQEHLDDDVYEHPWEDPDVTWGEQFKDRPCHLRVYVNEGVPVGIGPIIMDPDPAEVGRVSTVSVYLYGAQDEPVENEKVNWSIVEGGGTLTSSQSITNDLGIATTGYVPPLVPESVKIHAEVAY